jgi:hypothetical protein
VSERFPVSPPDPWLELSAEQHHRLWDRFDAAFGFRAGVSSDSWPAIHELAPSVTFDLSAIPDGPRHGAAYDAINAEALRCFVWALADVDEMVVLDWQHPAYRFFPGHQALTGQAEWKVPVYPDGDYYAFLTPDLSEGTFGHPWEKTLCVMGRRMVGSLGRSLATWLPIKRQNGASD